VQKLNVASFLAAALPRRFRNASAKPMKTVPAQNYLSLIVADPDHGRPGGPHPALERALARNVMPASIPRRFQDDAMTPPTARW